MTEITAMMGHQSDSQKKLFCYNANLDNRIPSDHPLRQIREHVDFDFIYDEVKDRYGTRGNVSVPPPVIVKMLLLLVLYNVRSERELMKTIPLRLDWLWFLGYDLESEIPNHSVLSKARRRWGRTAFKTFFERIVWQCVDAGLVDGSKLFADSSLVQADASNNSVVSRETLDRSFAVLETRLDAQEQSEQPSDEDDPGDDDTNQRYSVVNRKLTSTTDPDASVVRQGRGAPKLTYKVHRAVDERTEIITATEVTPGAISEAHRLPSLIDAHQKNTDMTVETVVADTKYGTVDNYLHCHDRDIAAHIPDLNACQDGKGRRKDIFPEEAFIYDPATDTYRCPANQTLKRRKHKKKRKTFEYGISIRLCRSCPLRDRCTRSKTGRTVKRHYRQDDLNDMRRNAQSDRSKRDIKTRQHLMERSFARATRYGYKRARWRNLWRVEIQEYLTAAVQNIMVFLRHVKEPKTAPGVISPVVSGIQSTFCMLLRCVHTGMMALVLSTSASRRVCHC
jgi:transposase